MWDWAIKIDSAAIRRAGSVVYVEGQAISSDTMALVPVARDLGAYGSDPMGSLLGQFAANVVPDTLIYFIEVGQATEDMGIAMGEIADAYDELAQLQLGAIGKLAKTVADLGIC